ncbi:MAG: caspase family protein [Herpetosiphonaceae bacterium]|nr:caspase family protein [Herpetosiphonaceae bacterium]
MAFDRGHALLIGIGTYANAPRLNTVPLTAADAQAVQTVLCDPKYCAYPTSQVQTLHDAAATRAHILSAFDTLANTTGPDDTVFVFYSGHGSYGTDGHYYLTAFDTTLQDDKIAAGSGVRDSELLTKLQLLKTRRAFLIFNACHSGELAPSLDTPALSDQSLPDTTASALLGTGEGRVIITACRQNQKSYFLRDQPVTLFAQALVDGLRGTGVQSRHGYISIFDLYDAVFSTVSAAVLSRWNLLQEPELTITQGIGTLAVALYQGTIPTGELGQTDRPPSLDGPVREVTSSESRSALNQLVSGYGNVAVGGNIGQNTVINTGGGDYAGSGIDKRAGVFISGGSVNGPVIGTNTGTINTSYGGPSFGSSDSDVLMQAQTELRVAIGRAQQRGDDDQVTDLQTVLTSLEAAQKATREGKSDRRATKLTEATSSLRSLANNDPALASLLALLSRA